MTTEKRIMVGSILRGNIVRAQYRPSENPLYQHNPFVEALHPVLTPENTSSLIRRRPVFFDEMRNWSAIRRAEQVMEIFHYIEPMPIHIDLSERISRTIRNGYLARNPLSKQWTKQMNSGFRELCVDRGGEEYTPSIRSNSSGFVVFGTSGSGKTTATESVLLIFDQVIIHTQYDGEPFDHKQLVWLKLECPSHATPSGLCRNFFYAVDEILGTNYAKNFLKSKTPQDELLGHMAKIAAVHGLGVLVIDEIQRLLKVQGGARTELLNFFVELSNKLGVPVVLVGTCRAVKLFRDSFPQARRSAGQGDMLWSNMAHDDIWDYFLQGLWEYQWTTTPVPLTPELSSAIYEESQGILDIAVKLYMLAQWHVISEDKEVITPDVIHQVAEEKMRIVRPLIQAIKNGDVEKLEALDDVVPGKEEIEKYLLHAKEKIYLDETLKTLRNQRLNAQKDSQSGGSPLIEVASFLFSAGFGKEIAEEAARRSIERHAHDFEISRAIRDALKMAEELEHEQEEKKPKKASKVRSGGKVEKTKLSLSGDMREIVKRSKKDSPPYDALKNAGLVIDVDELFGKGIAPRC